jgi:hypothetical protein
VISEDNFSSRSPADIIIEHVAAVTTFTRLVGDIGFDRLPRFASVRKATSELSTAGKTS